MKKLLFLCAFAALLAAGCAKTISQETETIYPDAPWVNDESLPVPIEFGDTPYGAMTKDAIVDLAGVEFGVLAYDTATNAELLKNVVARGGGNNVRASFITPSGDITYYYPLPTQDPDNNYSFFAYHVTEELIADNATAHNLTSGYTVDVAIDTTDVLWAKSEATPLVYSGETINGFNAKYARYNRKFFNNEYLPKLTFEQKTTALHIYAKAIDADAAATFKDGDLNLLELASLSLGGVFTQAVLDVTSGVITGSATGTLTHDQKRVVPTVAGVEYGNGFFILPTDGDLTLTYSLNVAKSKQGSTVNYSTFSDSLTLTQPQGGFVAGKSYRLNIVFRSLESIGIVADIEPWIVDNAEGEDIVTVG